MSPSRRRARIEFIAAQSQCTEYGDHGNALLAIAIDKRFFHDVKTFGLLPFEVQSISKKIGSPKHEL
jgi:hypothetical protein